MLFNDRTVIGIAILSFGAGVWLGYDKARAKCLEVMLKAKLDQEIRDK